MRLLIDNLDGRGERDYTIFVGGNKQTMTIRRKLNAPAQLKLTLTPQCSSVSAAMGGGGGINAPAFVIPVSGSHVILERNDGTYVFTGYAVAAASPVYAGWADAGPQYEYELTALSDGMMLDVKPTPPHPPFVARTAGSALEQMTEDLLPGWFDESGVTGGDTIPYFSVDPSEKWSNSAGEIATAARCSYRDTNGKLLFAPLAQSTYQLAETDSAFSPENLVLTPTNRAVNDVTMLGGLEPSAHVKDYFVGDGYTSTFYLSQIPFTRKSEVPLYNRTILDEDFTELDPTHWVVADPQHVISVTNGELVVAGGTGADGQTCVTFVEKLELGGATVLEHGDVVFNGPSAGVIGGLFSGAVDIGDCVAGFNITAAGSGSNIQALVNGTPTGTALTTQTGHHYLFTTQLYPTEIYRMQQVYHSSKYPSGNPRGGAAVACDVRVVLAVQDIDPSNPASQVAAATILYDGVIPGAPGFCTYALIDAVNMQCSVAFTYVYLAVDAMVRSTVSGQNTVTVPVGSLLEGGQCRVSNTPSLEFYAEYVPAADQTIEVTYRGQGHAMGRVMNSASIAGQKSGLDDGVRGMLRHVAVPEARTSADCENAALALLDDAGQGWNGEYQAWNKFLPGGAEDIFPGDGLNVNVPSRAAAFMAIVQEVDIGVIDLAGENAKYTIRFVDAGDPPLAFLFGTAAMKQSQELTPVDVSQVGSVYLSDLTSADFTNVTSTTVTIDAGFVPPAGWGIEVRTSDVGWGPTNSGNLIGRYTTTTITLSRYARAQSYFVRAYDNSTPPKYSRYSAALHVDYPL